jgi:hypothetical protein
VVPVVPPVVPVVVAVELMLDLDIATLSTQTQLSTFKVRAGMNLLWRPFACVSPRVHIQWPNMLSPVVQLWQVAFAQDVADKVGCSSSQIVDIVPRAGSVVVSFRIVPDSNGVNVQLAWVNSALGDRVTLAVRTNRSSS